MQSGAAPTPAARSPWLETSGGRDPDSVARLLRALFAAETARIMEAAAALMWANALGRGAPLFVPTEILIEATTTATGQSWEAIERQAHWGSWAVRAQPAPLTSTSAGSWQPRVRTDHPILRAASSIAELHEARA